MERRWYVRYPETTKDHRDATANWGTPLDENYLTNLGFSVLKAERKFNEAVGFKREDDRLPRFFLEEKLEPSGNVFDVPEEEIDSIYKF